MLLNNSSDDIFSAMTKLSNGYADGYAQDLHGEQEQQQKPVLAILKQLVGREDVADNDALYLCESVFRRPIARQYCRISFIRELPESFWRQRWHQSNVA